MARFRFGEGEYQYFANPLPPIVQALRATPIRAWPPIANAWDVALGGKPTYPPDLDGFLPSAPSRPDQAHAAAAALRGRRLQLPAPGSLRRDRVPAADDLPPEPPGRRFHGGEFLLVEQRPRAQSRGEVVPLEQGEIVIFATRRATGPRHPRRLPGGAAPWREPGYLGAPLHARGDLPRRGVVWRGEGGGRGVSGTHPSGASRATNTQDWQLLPRSPPETGRGPGHPPAPLPPHAPPGCHI